jgi:tetratricopeptide (TPR) repeat protein
MPIRTCLVFFLALLAGCASDVNRKNAETYYNAGLRAEFAGDWVGARDAYRRALANGRSGGLPAVFMSATTYNLGRAVAYTCDYAEAERLLRESVTLEQGLPAPDPVNMTKRWSELARLYQDEGRDREAASYYALAVPELERLGGFSDDPVGVAYYLDDYARALSASGQVSEAASVAARAADLRARTPERAARFKPLRYNTVCRKGG